MSPMIWFLFVLGVVSVVIYWMITRGQPGRAAQRSPYDGGGTDGSYGNSSSGDGWSLSSLFGGDGSSSHNSGSSSDSGGDSGGGGGGDGGGGGGGGGGD